MQSIYGGQVSASGGSEGGNVADAEVVGGPAGEEEGKETDGELAQDSSDEHLYL